MPPVRAISEEVPVVDGTVLDGAARELFQHQSWRSVSDALIRVGRRFLAAEASAVWRYSGRDTWRLVASSGLSQRFLTGGVRHSQRQIYREPIVIQDVSRDASLANRRGALQDEGIRSILAFPLRVGADSLGTLVFYRRSGRPFSEAEIQNGRLLSHLAGAALGIADTVERRNTELELITNSLPVMMSYADTGLRFRRVNKAYEEFFGRPEQDLIGRSVEEVVGPEHWANAKPRLERALQGERLNYRSRVRRKDGALREIELFYSPDVTPDGTVRGVAVLVQDITERKAAEEAKARLAAIVESSEDSIVSTSLDGVISSWNAGAEDIFGYSAAEAIGRHIDIIIPPDRMEEVQDVLARIAAGEHVGHFETERLNKNGSRIQVAMTVSPVRAEDGTVLGVSKFARNITGRKQSELRDLFLSRLDVETRLLTDADEITYLAARMLGEHLDVNRCAYADVEADADTFNLTGDFNQGVPSIVGRYRFRDFGAECLRQMRAGEAYIVEDSETDPRTAEVREAYRATGIRAVICVPVLKGNTFVAAMAVHQTQPRRWRSDEVDLVAQVAHRCWESIERARIQREMRAREREFVAQEQRARQRAELLNQVGPTLVAELDLGKLRQAVTDIATSAVEAEFGALFHNTVNEAGESYVLYTISGVPREAFASFPMPRNTAVFAPTFHGVGPVRSGDITQDPRYGKNSPYYGMPEGHLPVRSYLAVPVTSRNGNVLGGLFFGHSKPGVFSEEAEAIAMGIAAQAAIGLDNASLFIEAQRSQESLQRANEELRRANEDLKQFAHSASHDLQEPLRMISLHTELLQRRCKEAGDLASDPAFRYILRGTAQMDGLIRGLLAYTEASLVDPQAAPVTDLDSAVEDALLNLRASMERSGAQVTRAPLPAVRISRLHAMQVFQNLIGNAIKYRSERPLQIRIEVEEHGDEWIFSVTDNGIGIDPKYKELIFGIFKRLHTQEEYSGTGIGLAICHRIVERAGGRIWVESQLGSGASFRFSLPKAS